ncbi:hypothetical protein IT417_00960 [bacterium]|nr:hypothetical protein [bacterium]
MPKHPNNVIFKVRKGRIKKVNRIGVVLKTKSKQQKRVLQQIQRQFVGTVLLFAIFLLSIALLVLLGLWTYRYIVALRSEKEAVLSTEQVYGFDIPAYPGSEFIFSNDTDDETVKHFISLGNSVYRLPKDAEIADVFSFYVEQLPPKEWQHVLSVSITSEDRLFGEYWVKGDKGLRIYSRLNDVWYQTVTVKQAQTGLEDEVKKEIARKLLLLTTEKADLLPDFPWRLNFPTEYTAKYYATGIKSFQGVSFQRLGDNSIIYLEPVGYNGGNTYDGYIDNFIASFNKKHKSKWQVVNSVETEFRGEYAVRATVNKGSDFGSIVAVKNNSNTLIYVIAAFEENEPFFNYMLQNLTQVETVQP